MKNFFTKSKYWIIIIGIVIVGLVIDLVFKEIWQDQYFSVIDGVVSVYFTWNTGAAWSILNNQTIWLTIFTGIILAGLVVFNIFFKRKTIFYSISMGLIFAGAIGNFIDRVVFGAVRDFIRVDFFDFPIFNFADAFLTIGGILMAIFLVFIFNWKTGKKEISNEEITPKEIIKEEKSENNEQK